ncbi:MAG: hypothetical protein J1E41_07525 [Ruminococcus sp.]|nr:hypothetical protein [Ruminococcus sp.]
MSKKKSKKRKNPVQKKKQKDFKPLIIAGVAAIVCVVFIVITYVVYLNTSLEATDFVNKDFKSVSAFDASGDEADMNDIYHVRYDNYQGSLSFKGDGTFELWLTPGSLDDGVHSGSYTYNRDKQVLNATFDSGDKVKFKLVRNSDGTLKRIEVPYDGYTVYFAG